MKWHSISKSRLATSSEDEAPKAKVKPKAKAKAIIAMHHSMAVAVPVVTRRRREEVVMVVMLITISSIREVVSPKEFMLDDSLVLMKILREVATPIPTNSWIQRMDMGMVLMEMRNRRVKLVK